MMDTHLRQINPSSNYHVASSISQQQLLEIISQRIAAFNQKFSKEQKQQQYQEIHAALGSILSEIQINLNNIAAASDVDDMADVNRAKLCVEEAATALGQHSSSVSGFSLLYALRSALIFTICYKTMMAIVYMESLTVERSQLRQIFIQYQFALMDWCSKQLLEPEDSRLIADIITIQRVVREYALAEVPEDERDAKMDEERLIASNHFLPLNISLRKSSQRFDCSSIMLSAMSERSRLLLGCGKFKLAAAVAMAACDLARKDVPRCLTNSNAAMIILNIIIPFLQHSRGCDCTCYERPTFEDLAYLVETAKCLFSFVPLAPDYCASWDLLALTYSDFVSIYTMHVLDITTEESPKSRAGQFDAEAQRKGQEAAKHTIDELTGAAPCATPILGTLQLKKISYKSWFKARFELLHCVVDVYAEDVPLRINTAIKLLSISKVSDVIQARILSHAVRMLPLSMSEEYRSLIEHATVAFGRAFERANASSNMCLLASEGSEYLLSQPQLELIRYYDVLCMYHETIDDVVSKRAEANSVDDDTQAMFACQLVEDDVYARHRVLGVYDAWLNFSRAYERCQGRIKEHMETNRRCVKMQQVMKGKLERIENFLKHQI